MFRGIWGPILLIGCFVHSELSEATVFSVISLNGALRFVSDIAGPDYVKTC